MPLIQLKNVTLHYGAGLLLDGADLTIEENERICLLGRNGTGKSSLMRLLAGMEKPDSGELIRTPGAVVSILEQDVPRSTSGVVFDVIRAGIQGVVEEDWESDMRVTDLAEKMELPTEAEFSSLSGGLKRRVLLARALASNPRLLLLDEPTNHLDLESILWLEEFLLETTPALLFVTHDRRFLRRLATRILELDRGKLFGWQCDYETFLERKAAVLEAEEKSRATFEKKLAKEEVWIRQGVKARRTRNEGRVRALQKLRKERASWRQRSGKATLGIQDAPASGQRVLVASDLSFHYPGSEEPVIRNFSTEIWKGDKIGILGPNGSGKTTLLKLLLARLEPTCGSLRQGTNLEIVFLDQLRDQIDPKKSLAENVAGPAQTVTFLGRDRHIHSYLQDFLFSPDKARHPAGSLSGGEKNRLLLAKLFLQPANLLVLDEPTNDLDVETLELLEEILVSYTGTLLLVSHDRDFLDDVTTSLLVYEGDGRFAEIPGGYSDWLEWKAGKRVADDWQVPMAPEKSLSLSLENKASETPKGKFLNRERRELEEIPAKMEVLEKEQSELSKKLQDPDIFRTQPDRVTQIQNRLHEIEGEIHTLFARWEELDARRIELEGNTQ